MKRAYLYWSIYLRSSSSRKLKEAHLPPIDDALENLQFTWDVFKEDVNDDVYRIVTYQNFQYFELAEVIIPALRRAYALADGWKIFGLNAIKGNHLNNIYGAWKREKPANVAPALESAMFEIRHGQVVDRLLEGGWKIDVE